MDGLRFHDLRHMNATLAAESGASLRSLMARLGHASAAAAIRFQHTPEKGPAFLEAIARNPSYAVSRGGPMRYDRITVEPEKMGGVPCIRGLRFPVATVVGMVAEGLTNDEILADHPDLEVDDIRQALEYAAEAVRERQLPLRQGA